MNDSGKSDRPVVPASGANEGRAQARAEERREERGLAKGNPGEQTRFWTQGQIDLSHALDRIRDAARRDSNQRFTALWHHMCNTNRLREAYFMLKHDAAPGVDEQTWRAYGAKLEANLADLSERLHRGAYRAKPVKRVHIPKDDGGQRPIGVMALEDKIVQRAMSDVLNAVYEEDFHEFSYGFRPGRKPHDALDAVTVGIERRKINWVLDADIRGFFDTIDHQWLMRFLKHRIGDRRVLRQVKKWLNAGVLEEGAWQAPEEGVAQGGSISPLLGNIYLHYAFDDWVECWGRKCARGEVVVVRYADDFVVGFQHRDDAERFVEALGARLAKFNLELSAEKTRLIEFGRFAGRDRKRRGAGKPETFDFLGFTHICGQTRKGRFCVKRKTSAKKARKKLKALKGELRKRMHKKTAEMGRWLGTVLAGHYRYYGVPRNYKSMAAFRHAVVWLWWQILRRRSDKKHRLTWARMRILADRWLPKPQIVHPYPDRRLSVTTQGRSPVR